MGLTRRGALMARRRALFTRHMAHLYTRRNATVDTAPNPGAAGTAQSPRAQRAIRSQKATNN